MSATTNGASLEDCLTNIFSLIDLNGIRWKRFKHKENNSYLYSPIDTHPILTTYAKCIEENHIAVWRHEPHKRYSSGSGAGPGGTNAGPGGSAGHSNFPTPTRTSNNNTPTNSGLANLTGAQGGSSGNQNNINSSNNHQINSNNYELWIFGYGHQLRVENVIGEDLVEIEDDTWESKGLSYECRALLFKALHNLIERCLITKGFTRLGRWFVQPISENLINHHSSTTTNHQSSSTFTRLLKLPKLEPNSINTSATNTFNTTSTTTNTTTASQQLPDASGKASSNNLNFSSTISSTINRIINSRKELYDSRQCLDKSDGLRHTSIRSSSSYFTSSLDGSKSSLSFAFSFFVHGDSNICATVDVRQHPLVHTLTRNDLNIFQEGGIVRVALAPFGLNGILNGVSYKDSDNGAATTTFIQQWSRFYPTPKTINRLVPSNTSASTSAINSTFNQKTTPSSNLSSQYNHSADGHGSRSYLSNLTNMLLPPSQKPSLSFNHEPNEVPPVVEVIVAGYRMRYPSECVFTTSKVVDLYKTLNTSGPGKGLQNSSNKRPFKGSPNKQPNKLSLLSEKLNEDKPDPNNTKIKIETDQSKAQTTFNSPFKLNTKSDDSSNSSFTKHGELIKDKTTDSSSELEEANITTNPATPFMAATTTSTTTTTAATTTSRYNTSNSKVGYSSSNIPLGPSDLVKLFPTPPSLEQTVLSPSNTGEEATPKEVTTLSPINLTISNTSDIKDSGIDVYKPVECALMPPPPKWAALTNIVISSSKSLPPECIYKGSNQKSSSKNMVINKFCETNKGNPLKYLSSTKQCISLLNKSTYSMQSSSSPLADQTNKNGFNSHNLISSYAFSINNKSLASPTASTSMISANSSSSSLKNSLANTTSLLGGIPTISTNFNQSNLNNGIQLNSTTASSLTTFSSFTSPHQRLFNNLNEINSIQLNLMISDSVLGVFKDHNFDSCTLCVCNMSIKGTQIDTLPQKLETSTPWRQSLGSDSLLNNTSVSNEFINECTCGFSALTNRHCSHLSGLFLEDELELTNVLYDPTEMIDQNKLFRKLRLSNYSNASYSEEQKLLSRLIAETNNKFGKSFDEKNVIKQEKVVKDDKSSSQSSHTLFEETKLFVIDQLKQQCSSMIHSNSSLSKVLLIESFRNNRQLTTCSNYYAQVANKNSGNMIFRFLDDSNKYTTVKMLNRNPVSLRFSDFCEISKGIITKLGTASQNNNSRISNSLVKPLGGSSTGFPALGSAFMRVFSTNRQTGLIGKPGESRLCDANSIFIQGLQALVLPTLAIDPKGALQLLEQLVKEESKEALATLNKAILIFSSPIHDWQFLTAPIPENNFDVANLLKLIQPSLDESIGSHNKIYKDFVHQQQQHIFSARDSPTGAPTLPTPPCQGPLTWRQFHQAAGRGTEDQCEPQPIPSLLVSHHVEKNHLAVSPFALKFWDKLLLEPYAPSHNMFYLVIAPENQSTINHLNTFFRELSNTYELMKLGKHAPIGNGLIIASQNSQENSNQHESWFSQLEVGENEFYQSIVEKMKSYAAKMTPALAKTIVNFLEERQPPNNPHADRFESSPNPQPSKPNNPVANRVQQQNPNKTFTNFLSATTGNCQSQQENPIGLSSLDTQANTDMMAQQLKSQTLIGSIAHGTTDDTINAEEEASKQTGIVLYMIDPFSSPSVSQNHRTLSTICLLKCYSFFLDNLPETIRRITQVQLISQDSIISHSRPILGITKIDQLKSLSMNVYSRCRKIQANPQTAKSLTGFGPSAALESFFKTKSPELSTCKVFTPPFILAPMKDKQTELGEMFGDRKEKSCVLFCSYCITEDQRWLLASITNDKGDMSETTVINTNILDRMKKPKASVRRIALRKLMDFIISVMSEWTHPWRLIIGKLGRVGHGELKEWAVLMSKRSLLNYSRLLTERCRQCFILPPMETVSILSACLVSLESDSKLRIMPDQFTSDDRQASFNKCPLSTPEDASATHILVFPTSASIQSAHGNVEDPLAGSGLDDDLLNQFPLEDGIEDLGVEENMDDLFLAWDDNPTNVSDNIISHHDTMLSSSNLPMGSGSVGDGTNNQDETLQLLQQPLALGYYISTAKIGQLPNWFWSTSPHLRNSCPVFLKSALHIHMPCVQLSDDLLHSGVGQSRKSHQLDSNLTTDILRYVLEGYNSLSWLALNPKTYDRQSCLPVHMQNLLQLYHLMESFS